jgi:hypothetical protein
MSRHDPFDTWTFVLANNLPNLSKPQLRGLAEWSFGMVLARCCSLDHVASYMADWLEQPELSVRSRLREWYLPADRKSVSNRGDKRRELPVHTRFAPLLDWLRRDWPEPRLALALDASTLADRFG